MQDIEGLKNEAEYFKEPGCEGYRYRTVDGGVEEKKAFSPAYGHSPSAGTTFSHLAVASVV